MAATHDGAHSSTRTYWTVGVILAIVTAIEVVAALPGVIYDPAHRVDRPLDNDADQGCVGGDVLYAPQR
jgi:hypothetical protein